MICGFNRLMLRVFGFSIGGLMKRFVPVLLVILYSFHSLAAETPTPPIKYPPVTVELTLTQVSDHTWYARGIPGVATDNEGFISNAGVIIGDDGIIVIDSLGSPSLADALVRRIREISDLPIRRVIVTHYHADHIYGLQRLVEEGAEILAPVGADDYLGAPNAEERLEERRFSLDPWVNDNTYLVAPDRMLQEPESFHMGGVDITVTPVGAAHSDGDLTVYVEPDQVLFSGDLIFEGRVPFLGDSDAIHWAETLKRMRTKGVAALVPGHGGVAEQPDQALGLTADYLDFLSEQMGNAVDDFVPFAEAYDGIDWSRFADLPAFEAANRRNAYQVYLLMEASSLGQ